MINKFKTRTEAEIFGAKTFEDAQVLITDYIEQQNKELEAIEAALPYIKNVQGTVKNQAKITRSKIEEFSNLLDVIILAITSEKLKVLLASPKKFTAFTTDLNIENLTYAGLLTTDWELLLSLVGNLTEYTENASELKKFKYINKKEGDTYDDDEYAENAEDAEDDED